MSTIYLALPSRGVFVTGAIPGIVAPSSEPHIVIRSALSHSLLTRSFNILWCRALNMNPRPDYFAMMHDDVSPEPGWLDVLLKELKEHDADVVSSLIAIKDDSQETSTCFFLPEKREVHRIKYSQALELPPTFGKDDLPAGTELLLNTGLWVCKFKDCKLVQPVEGDQTSLDIKPWVERFTFGQSDHILFDGKEYKADTTTEDWEASMRWNKFGLKILATRKVKISHIGAFGWSFGGTGEADRLGVLREVKD